MEIRILINAVNIKSDMKYRNQYIVSIQQMMTIVIIIRFTGYKNFCKLPT